MNPEQIKELRGVLLEFVALYICEGDPPELETDELQKAFEKLNNAGHLVTTSVAIDDQIKLHFDNYLHSQSITI